MGTSPEIDSASKRASAHERAATNITLSGGRKIRGHFN
jgi:hypothetical protein